MHRQSRQIDFIAAVKCRKSNLIKRFGRKAEKNLFPLTQRSSLINFTFCVISFRIHVNLSIERERAISLGCALHKFPGSLLSRICVIRSIHLPWSETVVVHSPLTESALSCWSPGEITHKKAEQNSIQRWETRDDRGRRHAGSELGQAESHRCDEKSQQKSNTELCRQARLLVFLTLHFTCPQFICSDFYTIRCLVELITDATTLSDLEQQQRQSNDMKRMSLTIDFHLYCDLPRDARNENFKFIQW